MAALSQRDVVLRDLWCKHGCPEKMTIRVQTTGEVITLINGLPVTDNAETNPLFMRYPKAKNRGLRAAQLVRDNRVCAACTKRFYSKREDAKYCSQRCQKRAKREQEAQRRRAQQERLLAAS